LASLFLIAAGGALAEDCSHSAQRTLDLPADGLSDLKLQTRAGDLRITGVAGLKQLEFRGKACASTAEALEQLTLQQTRSGSTQNVVATAPEQVDGSWFGSSYAYIDLEVRVPQSLALQLDDSSGDIEIDDAGAVELRDSSGDIRISRAHGDLRIADSSGDIDVDQAEGAVTVSSDSSGDIEIDGVRRDVLIDDDSSGDVKISGVGGNARVDRDSSGDIRFRRITGNAEVGSDSSGNIRADGVTGDFTVKSKSGGSSNIEHSDVSGKVSLPDNG
jgi:DUF4097 and DUF4098 domain-containing protein YvlB